MRKVIKEPLALALSFVKKVRIMNQLEEEFIKEFKDDIRQEIALRLLENQLSPFSPIANTEENRRLLFRIVSQALYHVAQQTWYRRRRDNTWIRIFSILEEEVE